jgi:hypothetical protein
MNLWLEYRLESLEDLELKSMLQVLDSLGFDLELHLMFQKMGVVGA